MADAIGGMNVSKYVILLIMTAIYMVLGMFMDGMAMVILTVPIFLPIIEELGWNAIWFGIYIIITMEMGAISPPGGSEPVVIYQDGQGCAACIRYIRAQSHIL